MSCCMDEKICHCEDSNSRTSSEYIIADAELIADYIDFCRNYQQLINNNSER